MPQTPEEVAAAAFDAGLRREDTDFVALVHPEAELCPFTALTPYRGKEGAAEWLESVTARFGHWHGERREVEVIGSTVIHHGEISATTVGGETLPTTEVSWVWTIRDGLVWRLSLIHI